MKPVAFRYERPESVEEAVALLGEHEDAKVIAGGQSLVPMLNMRLARPSLLVDVNRLPLGEIARENGSWRVGATVRQADPRLAEIPLLAECLPYVGHFVTRNRGTVGGSIAHADAAAELPLALTALGGSVVTSAVVKCVTKNSAAGIVRPASCWSRAYGPRSSRTRATRSRSSRCGEATSRSAWWPRSPGRPDCAWYSARSSSGRP